MKTNLHPIKNVKYLFFSINSAIINGPNYNISLQLHIMLLFVSSFVISIKVDNRYLFVNVLIICV